ncbi:transmembrane protein, putative (macronuclear) [Tetrahymena thermophila SB210]|uniref:Transmembrane protein, putative n=1 Tax=Tetrahymena thermophila (strain SB210) TaxID=312017 RepID=W7XHJ3_TETTS|nr:transmembrane protein, putative [Tetrahymena thermophila SB210]EWS73851.1 transmembrane protein, putative [Tetrahymena thermophila SB210]|eukprot:XP_012653598.1 transmembrane protein, putative [Tetrahymena thermophila SB210]
MISKNQQTFNYDTDCNNQYGSPYLQSEQYNLKQVSNQVHAEFPSNKGLNFGFIPNAVEIFSNLRINAAKNIQIPPAPQNYFEGCDDSSARAIKESEYEIDLVKASLKQIQQEQHLNFDGLIYEQHTNLLDSNFVSNMQDQICKKNTQFSSRQIAAGQVIQSAKQLQENLIDIYKSNLIYFYLDLIPFFACFLAVTIMLASDSQTAFIPILVILIVITCIKINIFLKLVFSLKKSNPSGLPGGSQCCGVFLQILTIPFSLLTITLMNQNVNNIFTCLPLAAIGSIFSLLISLFHLNKIFTIKSIMNRIGCLFQKYPDSFIQ